MLTETLIHLLRDNYTEAKIRGKKSLLLGKPQLHSLAEFGSLGEILGFLADGPYGTELSKLQEASSPVEVERAVRSGFARTVRNIISSAKGNVEQFIEEYIRRFEAYDLATLLIYKAQARPWEEFFAARESISKTFDTQLRRYYSADDPGKVIGLIGDEDLRSRMKGVSLEELTPDKASLIRDILNGWGEEKFYRHVVSKLHGRDKDSCLPIAGTRIDLVNLSIVLRSKLIRIPAAKSHLIPVRWKISERTLNELSSAEDVSVALDTAGSITRYRTLLTGARQKYEETKSLAFLETSVRNEMVEVSRRTLLKFPNSMGVVFAFLTLLENESRNIAAIVSGVGAGLKPEAIKPLIVS